MGEQEVYSNGHRVSEAGERQINGLAESLPTKALRFPLDDKKRILGRRCETRLAELNVQAEEA